MQQVDRQKIQVQAWVFGIGVLILVAKFVAYWLTNSNAILTDAVESIANVAAGAFALQSLWLAAKPRDRNHPYGHGKVEFVAAAVEGSLITVAGGLMIAKALYDFSTAHTVQHLDQGLWIVAVAGLLNYLMGFVIERQGRILHSLTMIAEGKHLKTDAYSTVGMMLGLGIIVWTGQYWVDNLLAILLGAMICFTGAKVLRKSWAGITDEADEQILRQLITALEQNRKPAWVDIHNFRVIQYGANWHIDCHLTLPRYFTIEEGHEAVKEVEDLIAAYCPQETEFFIHVDACVDTSCAICHQPDCPIRKALPSRTVVWRTDNVVRNQKHR
ncbi:cation diffusion facilitator family transporter [Eisenibacter elegans]|jgi:cation diffusion facilitator family transporter|uniref:cation diffusion facilitator family transporter n=1 Tax=Eisenibacter elegans TaxID=997 RepID=UPI0004055B0D|nr:cation diffusion facilitator family transporter [Eisenibacter elegans]